MLKWKDTYMLLYCINLWKSIELLLKSLKNEVQKRREKERKRKIYMYIHGTNATIGHLLACLLILLLTYPVTLSWPTGGGKYSCHPLLVSPYLVVAAIVHRGDGS